MFSMSSTFERVLVAAAVAVLTSVAATLAYMMIV